MNLKKCGFLLVFVMMFCFAIPNFASAESNTDVSKGMLNGKEFSSNASRYDLGGSYSIDSLYIFGKNTSASGGFLTVRLYNSKNTLVWYGSGYEFRYLGSSHKGDEYKPDVKRDDVRYIEVSVSGGGKIVTFKALGKEYIPEISNLKAIADYKKVTLSWENPANSNNATSTKLYQDGKEIKTFNLSDNVTSYVVENLEEGKNYTFKMSVVDKNGRETNGITKSIRTLMPVIDPPKNVFLTPQDKKIVVAWDDVKSPFLKGYNVYVDGKKINKEPLTSSKLIVKNLENDKAYKIQVSAVNKIDVEGKRSEEKTETPSSDALEVEYDVKMPFGLKDVIDVAMMLLLIVAPLTLLGLAFIYYKPIVTFLYNSIQKKK
ncbi:hypothetical protein CON66_30285 [Bacillus cereus]|uniref:fibronectin type III domain-containing protein n=1 Tax=Bacillus cereus TaxID=1396 RepID=UPI000BECCEDE|nr:fibronectin type III domain-containing protein [Bacillus cereus]PEA92340.1 hypothetical protein CON66_30285 [Bacillus cereus]PGN67252.1 hypothetical protein CN964_28995 [Bacillus cereus]PGU74459.1 hypothetical protein COD68_31725 [Bacillus cereus]